MENSENRFNYLAERDKNERDVKQTGNRTDRIPERGPTYSKVSQSTFIQIRYEHYDRKVNPAKYSP